MIAGVCTNPLPRSSKLARENVTLPAFTGAARSLALTNA